MLEADFYGGFRLIEIDGGGDTTLLLSSKRVQAFSKVNGEAVILPDARTLKLGGPYFFIMNIKPLTGPTALRVRDSLSTLLFSLSANRASLMSLLDNTTQAGVWGGQTRSVVYIGS